VASIFDTHPDALKAALADAPPIAHAPACDERDCVDFTKGGVVSSDVAELLDPPLRELGPTAGIVRTPGVDNVIETLEGQVDFVEGYASKFFEGHELDKDEARKRERELSELAKAVNLRIADIGVRIVGAFPELKGKGALLRGVDLLNREYSIELHLDDEQRMRGDTFDAMLDGLDTVNMIERGIRLRLDAYLEEERLDRLGIVRGKKAN
jgi:hypothetical protein